VLLNANSEDPGEIDDFESRLQTSASTKPTVVIAEDHFGCLEDLSRLIATDYEVVAVAADGRHGGRSVEMRSFVGSAALRQAQFLNVDLFAGVAPVSGTG